MMMVIKTTTTTQRHRAANTQVYMLLLRLIGKRKLSDTNTQKFDKFHTQYVILP